MQTRLAFAVGWILTYLSHRNPLPLESVVTETAALRSEICEARLVVLDLQSEQETCAWAVWYQKVLLRGSALLDLLLIGWIIWKYFQTPRLTAPVCLTDTGGSSSDTSEFSEPRPSGRKLALFAGKGSAELTLDIPDVQLVVNFPADADCFYWHHRILLHRIGNGVWFDIGRRIMKIARHDLNAIPHRILERRNFFPHDIADEIYAHDPIGKAQLSSFKRRGQNPGLLYPW